LFDTLVGIARTVYARRSALAKCSMAGATEAITAGNAAPVAVMRPRSFRASARI
jgi:hypothetical protein